MMRIILVVWILFMLAGCTEGEICQLRPEYAEVIKDYPKEKRVFFMDCLHVGKRSLTSCDFSMQQCLTMWSQIEHPPTVVNRGSSEIVKGAAILGGAHILGKMLK